MKDSTGKTKRQSIKLRKGRRSIFDLPRGCRIIVEGRPTDGKPAVLVEFPDGTIVRHETLTPPPDAA